MARLNIQRQNNLEPKRMEYAIKAVENEGYEIFNKTEKQFQFWFKSNVITVFPYSGWFSGKGLVAGRGLINLLKQIEK